MDWLTQLVWQYLPVKSGSKLRAEELASAIREEIRKKGEKYLLEIDKETKECRKAERGLYYQEWNGTIEILSRLGVNWTEKQLEALGIEGGK